MKATPTITTVELDNGHLVLPKGLLEKAGINEDAPWIAELDPERGFIVRPLTVDEEIAADRAAGRVETFLSDEEFLAALEADVTPADRSTEPIATLGQ